MANKNSSIDGLTLRPRQGFVRQRPKVATKSPHQVSGVFFVPKKLGATSQQAKAISGKAAIRAQVRQKVSKQKNPTQEDALRQLTKEVDDFKISKLGEDGTEQSRAEAVEEFLRPVKSFDLDITSEELRKAAKTEKKMSRMINQEKPRRGGKIKLLLKLAPLVIVVTAIGLIYKWGDGIVNRITGGRSGALDIIGAFTSDKTVPLKTDEKGRTNILLFGTSGYKMDGLDHDAGRLTDSLMVVSFDEKNNDAAMLSLPRDLKMERTCTATGKINEVYMCNNLYDKDEKAGEEALRTTIEKLLGLKIQYSVHMNWGSLVKIVDSLGGVTVTLDEDVNDVHWAKIVVKKGVPTKLNGQQALALARARHGTAGGDFTRGNSQQKILIAIQKRALEKGLGFNEVFDLINAVGDNLRMTMTIDEIKTAVKLGQKFDIKKVRQISLTDWTNGNNYFKPANINGISYVVPIAGIYEYGEIQKYLKKQLDVANLDTEKEKILVLNGSGGVGAASQERTRLENAGFKVKMVGDAPEREWNEKYTVYIMNEAMPKKLAKLKEFYKEKAKFLTAAELPTEVKNGKDFDFVVVLGKPN